MEEIERPEHPRQELPPATSDVVRLSAKKFLAFCVLVSAAILWIGRSRPFSPETIAVEVFITIVALFIFGSIKYQLDKNALTYGAMLVIASTFFTGWWPASGLRQALHTEGLTALASFIAHHGLTLHGLDQLVHADTMLFILGLTFFVSVIAQTRILESVSFFVLRKNKGSVLPTLGALIALVSFASGILDGVSMIGLLIRTMVIILFLSKTKDDTVVFAVILSTVVTTVCGMWLAYGEPPNLIMKANLHPLLDDAFFLRYCLPGAVGSFVIVYFNLRRLVRGKKVDLEKMDVLDVHTADVRFLQAYRHGEVLIPHEFLEQNQSLVGSHYEAVSTRLHHGEPLGAALIAEKVPAETRKKLLSGFISSDLAEPLDRHYHDESAPSHAITSALDSVRKKRVKSQKVGALSFIPFIGLLVWHAVDHSVPLFWSSFAGFGVAMIGIFPYKRMRKLALGEGRHEYMEYLFLFPLFLSITLLQKSGFFAQLAAFLHQGIEMVGITLVALAQFFGVVVLSALLDNNVVADFAGRALRGLDLPILHLFAMAQIAGYAVGGCWTHIGSAQSVVAFSFIKREIKGNFSPFRWIKLMTPIVLEISIFMIVLIYAEGFLTGLVK